jgi:hypothetical protein
LVDWGSDNYNVGPIALDSQNNLYVGGLYTNNVVKIPFVGGAYVAAPLPNPSGTPPTPANCTGTDTAECNFGSNLTNAGNGYYFGVSSMAFDAAGDFFFGLTNANTAPDSIWECTAACISTGTPAATLVYQEPTSTTAAQLQVGGLAIDPWGDLFFTDSLYNGSKNESLSSNVNELAVSTGTGFGGATTGFAAAPSVLYTETLATPGAYDDEIDAVAVDQVSGTVYFADQFNGIYAFPNSSGTVISANLYTVSTQGSKLLTLDAKNNLYGAVYSTALSSGGADTAFQALVNSVVIPGTIQVGDTASTSFNETVNLGTPPVATVVTGSYVTVVDNNSTCSASPSMTVATSGTDPSEFAAADTLIVAPATALLDTECTATLNGGGSYPVTVMFTPTAGGTQTATLTTTDGASNTGTATVSGFGQALIPQTIAFTTPAASELVAFGTAPITLAATGGASGNPVTFTLDASSTAGAGTLSGSTLTIAGPGSIVIDANQAATSTYAAAPQAQLTITVTQATQTIAFTAPTATTYVFGVAPITLAATGGASGDPVVFTVDASSSAGAGTISGSTLTITGPGNIIIDANQAGNADYSAATQVQLTLTVSQATQTITFTAASPVTYSATPIALSATGGASGNPVVFTVASGPGSITGGNLTITGLGTIVVDANQAGNADYTAAAQVQQSIVVNAIGTVGTPSFNPAGGTYYGTATTVQISSATAGAAIWFTTDGTTPGVGTGTSTLYTAAIPLPTEGTTTVITAIAVEAGYTNSATNVATYNITSIPPNFTLALTPPFVIFGKGQTTGTITVSVTPQNPLNAPVTFACSGLPGGATCSFAPASLTTTGTTLAQTTLTISTGSSTASLHRNSSPLFPGATLAVALCLFGFRKRRRLQMILLLAVSVVGLSLFTGCGGSSSTTLPTATAVTLTATSGPVSNSQQFTVIVEK